MSGDTEHFSVDEIMRMIKKERQSARKNQQNGPGTKDKTSKIAPYEEAIRIKAQNFINQNWHINIHTDDLPFRIDDPSDEQKELLEFLNRNYTLPLSYPFESRSRILGMILNPFKRIVRKTILSSIGHLFTRQEQFNSQMIRMINSQTFLLNQLLQIIQQLNGIIARQRELNLNFVSFCNQVNFREDVLTIKSQHTEELIRELYRRMDNLFVVSNLAYILDEKVKKLQEDIKSERQILSQEVLQGRNQSG